MLSKASKYAISAVLYLTNNSSTEHKLSSKEIADSIEIPAPFLAKTMQQLTKKRIISSIKGPHGGFYLSEKNLKKTLFDIIECVDDIEKFNSCYLGQNNCNENNPCVAHFIYAPFKDKLIRKLKTKTILEMAKEYEQNIDFKNKI
jgi:Rrf2 family protein